MIESMRGFKSIVIKEILHLRRDPATVVIALMIPLIQLFMYGVAIDFDIRHIRTIVVDMDHSPESRTYIEKLKANEYMDVVRMGTTPDDAEQALRSGQERIGVIIPPDFARRSTNRDTPTVRILVDGSDSQVATRARMALMSPPSVNVPGMIEPRVDVLFNPQMRTQTFMIPGLIGVLLQVVTVSLTSFSLVREKEQGTLDQLMVSPVGKLGLMLGKLLPYAGLAMLEMAIVLLAGWLVFDVSVAGSVVLLFVLAVPFVVAALAIGLLISTVAQNQAQALQMSMMIMMPSILLSGFIFPRETMPGALYLLTDVFPVTYFLNILRGIVVRGAGIADLWQDALALVIIAVALITLATSRFRKSAG